MKAMSFLSGAAGVFTLALLAQQPTLANPLPTPQAPIANNCVPGSTSCPGFGDIGAECCPWSDASLKTEVKPLQGSTQRLLQLQGVSFTWAEGNRKDIGLIAQNVEKVYPELIRHQGDLMQVDYQKLVAPLIETIRELNARIDKLEAVKPR